MGANAIAAAPPPEVGLGELLRAFAVIGLSSFGGGLSGWLYREMVERRRWLSEHDFLAGLSLARAMPGANVVNLSIWIGHRLRGRPGALAAAGGVMVGPLFLIVGCAALYQRFGRTPALHEALLGIAAAALGLSLSMGLKSLRAAVTAPAYGVVFALTFVGVGVLRWPLVPVIAVLAPLSIAWAHLEEGADER
jgi:chromate transporter